MSVFEVKIVQDSSSCSKFNMCKSAVICAYFNKITFGRVLYYVICHFRVSTARCRKLAVSFQITPGGISWHLRPKVKPLKVFLAPFKTNVERSCHLPPPTRPIDLVHTEQ
jgi:hypothetical protein